MNYGKQEVKLNEIRRLEEDNLEAVAGGGPFPPGSHPHPPIKTKSNSVCEKCGRKIPFVSGKQVEGRGLVYVVYCSACNLHWIYEEVAEFAELKYVYLERDPNNEDLFHIIPKPF